MKKSTAMIALGGNSLSPKGVAGSIEQQFRYTRDTMDGLSILLNLTTIFVLHMEMDLRSEMPCIEWT